MTFLNHSVNRAQQKSSCACRSGANSYAHGSACFLDARAKMGDSGCSTCTTSRMRLTTEFATAAITVTQSSGNTRSSEMLVIDAGASHLVDQHIQGARVRPEKRCHDLTLPFTELIERRFHFHSVRASGQNR